MSDSDTVKLLRECNSGIQMAVFSIDEILEKVTDKNLILNFISDFCLIA